MITLKTDMEKMPSSCGLCKSKCAIWENIVNAGTDNSFNEVRRLQKVRHEDCPLAKLTSREEAREVKKTPHGDRCDTEWCKNRTPEGYCAVNDADCEDRIPNS